MLSLSSLFKKNSPQQQDPVERYKHYRQVGLKLNLLLVKQLPKIATEECGKKLGIFKAGTLILNNEDEIAILYDYALHHYRRAEKTVIERYLEQTPPAPESDEAMFLQAMLTARYSLFRVEGIGRGSHIILRDILANDTVDLIDIGLSQTGMPGRILVGRILPMGDFYMSSGTMIPLPEGVYEASIQPIVRKFMGDKAAKKPLSRAQEAAFVAQIIRVALHAGGADNVFYTDIE
jgi:hypothetical protein